jgi:hypothetical protein
VKHTDSLSLLLVFAIVACKTAESAPEHATGKKAPEASQQEQIEAHAKQMLAMGRDVFRDDTFASEEFWGGKLQLHKAILGEKQGGVGPGVSPRTALSVGLKVDAERVPKAVAEGIKNGTVSLGRSSQHRRALEGRRRRRRKSVSRGAEGAFAGRHLRPLPFDGG